MAVNIASTSGAMPPWSMGLNPYAPATNLGCNLAGSPLALDSTAQKLLAYIPSPNLAVPTGEGQNYLLQARTPGVVGSGAITVKDVVTLS